MSLSVEIYKKLGDFTLDTAFETDGGVLGLLGASGCGKSMTLMCIAGIVKPDRGKIVLDGTVLFDSANHVDCSPQQRRVGYLFQNYALFPNMTVRENILCGLRHEKNRAAREKKLSEMIGLMQLEGYERHKPSQISGGQQQRVALARILASDPKLLMLDEPFSALDSHLRGQLQVQLQALLKQFDKNVLMVTHSRTEAYRMCPRIALLDEGKLIGIGETERIFDNPASRKAAILTGCKNVVDAHKCGEHKVEVPAWGGLKLTVAAPVRDDLCAIAIRAHYFSDNTSDSAAQNISDNISDSAVKNIFPITITGTMEEPFERIVQFRVVGQNENAPDIWWRYSKEIPRASSPTHLGVAATAIYPLYS